MTCTADIASIYATEHSIESTIVIPVFQASRNEIVHFQPSFLILEKKK
jgi:hypothetical protein